MSRAASGAYRPRDLDGRVVLITGGNRGLGFFTALRLVERGASVVLACRDHGRSRAALQAIQRAVPGASVSTLPLDLTDPGSIADAGAELRGFERLDAFVANAGLVKFPRRRRETRDGVELLRQTNFYGHFALIADALVPLRRTEDSRVVSLSSLSVLLARVRVDDLELRRHYGGFQAYAQSKVAFGSFGMELARRLRGARSGIRSLVAHPGYAISGRTRGIRGVNEPTRATRFADNLQASFAQGKEQGAEPIVLAVTDPDARGGDHYGPVLGMRGRAVRSPAPGIITDPVLAAAIWRDAEEVTGVRYPV